MDGHVHFNKGNLGEFLNKHDLVYEKPADVWDKGIPLANSLVSALIWGKEKINVTLNRLDVWEMRRFQPDMQNYKWRKFVEILKNGQSNDYGEFGQRTDRPAPQQIPVGRFEVMLKGKEIHNYGMRLSLHDAIATGSYGTEFGGIEWKCYVSAEHPIIVFNYKLHGNEEAHIKFRFTTELGEYAADHKEIVEKNPFRSFKNFKLVRGNPDGIPEFAQLLKNWGYPEPERFEDGSIKFFKQAIPENGNYSIAWTEISHNENEKTLIVSLACDPVEGKAETEAKKIIEMFNTPETLAVDESAHKVWWHGFYPSSFYSIQDTRLEALYWINLYKLGCSTRVDRIAPPMCGPWQPDNGFPEFLGNSYIWNTQQQVFLFAIYTANRLDLGISTYNLLINNRNKMAEFCKNFFEVDGEYLPHLTDWKLGCPYYTPDHFQFVSGPWMCQLLWKHYKYSMDENFLRNPLFSMMKAQLKPLLSLLERGEDNKLHLPYTMSPEYQGEQETIRWSLNIKTDFTRRFGSDATCDLAYIRFLCNSLIEAADILGIEDEDQKIWEDTLRDLSPFCLDEFGGLKVRRDLKLESSHRHLSHLFPISQLHQINYEDAEGKKIIDRSLYVLKLRGTGEWMGWTFSEVAKIAILAQKPALAYMLVKEYCDKYVQENTFDCDGSNNDCAMTMHGNYGLTVESDGMYCDALQYFACRSINGVIHVMDVLPDAWSDISFWNFRAEGAFLVSSQRRNGHTDFISIIPEKGGKVRLVSGLGKHVEIICENEIVKPAFIGDQIEFESLIGKEYIIYEQGMPPKDLWISPVPEKPYERNYFGVKINGRY